MRSVTCIYRGVGGKLVNLRLGFINMRGYGKEDKREEIRRENGCFDGEAKLVGGWLER